MPYYLSEEFRTASIISIALVCVNFYIAAQYLYLSHRLRGVATTIVSFAAPAVCVFLLTGLALPNDANLLPLRAVIAAFTGFVGVGRLWRGIRGARRNPQVAQWPYSAQDEVGSRSWQWANLVMGFVLGAVTGAWIMYLRHPQTNYLFWGAVFGIQTSVLNADLLNFLARRLPRRW